MRQGRSGEFRVQMSADRPAMWTWAELSGADARWSDNFLHLWPGRSVELIARPAEKMSLSDFRRRLKIRSLADTYLADTYLM